MPNSRLMPWLIHFTELWSHCRYLQSCFWSRWVWQFLSPGDSKSHPCSMAGPAQSQWDPGFIYSFLRWLIFGFSKSKTHEIKTSIFAFIYFQWCLGENVLINRHKHNLEHKANGNVTLNGHFINSVAFQKVYVWTFIKTFIIHLVFFKCINLEMAEFNLLTLVSFWKNV